MSKVAMCHVVAFLELEHTKQLKIYSMLKLKIVSSQTPNMMMHVSIEIYYNIIMMQY